MKFATKSFVAAHVLLAVLVIVVIWVPNLKKVQGYGPFLVAIAVMEALYLLYLWRGRGDKRSAGDLMLLIWAFLLLWDILTAKLNKMHPVLVPAPENVFYVFASQYKNLLYNVASSMELLAVGFVLGISLGVLLGLAVGWNPRLRGVFFPIAQVLRPFRPLFTRPISSR